MPKEDKDHGRAPTFEETYPKYEFSELVRLGLLLAGWVESFLRASVRISCGTSGAIKTVKSEPAVSSSIISLRRGAARFAPIPGGVATPETAPEGSR